MADIQKASFQGTFPSQGEIKKGDSFKTKIAVALASLLALGAVFAAYKYFSSDSSAILENVVKVEGSPELPPHKLEPQFQREQIPEQQSLRAKPSIVTPLMMLVAVVSMYPFSPPALKGR